MCSSRNVEHDTTAVRDYHFWASCRRCGKFQTLLVNLDDMNAWNSRKALIQDAMPYLSAGEREFLISETCEECFDELTSE